VSGASGVFVKPDSDPGVKILHGSIKVFIGSGGDDVVMVCHEDDVVDQKVIFFMGFLECLEDDTDDVALVEPEGPVVCSADQVIGQLCLYDSSWPSHALLLAKTLPTCHY
jgi:hypothetical protein